MRIFFLLLVLLIEVSAAEYPGRKMVVLPPKKPSNNVVKPLIYGSIISRLGNQLFQVSAALSLGYDHNVPVYFPDFKEKDDPDVQFNGKNVFFRLNFDKPGAVSGIYNENENLLYYPIPYKPGIKLVGYFQSEKFFAHNWEKIKPYFQPTDEILFYLNQKYGEILSHPLTVAVHIRNYLGENAGHSTVFEILGRDYYDKAIDYFPDDALFVIFSDDIPFAKKLLADLGRPHIYIEGNHYVYDLYLMSLMKHQIIANSSFSWWGAYLNNNPYKIVISPKKWFNPKYHAKDTDIRPAQWIVL